MISWRRKSFCRCRASVDVLQDNIKNRHYSGFIRPLEILSVLGNPLYVTLVMALILSVAFFDSNNFFSSFSFHDSG